MKRIILVLVVLLLSGCTKITNDNLSNILDRRVDETLENRLETKNNQYRINYSYYLPMNSMIDKTYQSNDVILLSNTRLYMFVDLYAYKKSIDISYQLVNPLVYENEFTNNNQDYQINVYQDGSQYIAYVFNDYSRVSSIVEIGFLPETIESMVNILVTLEVDENMVKFNDSSSDEIVQEEVIDLFKSKVKKDNIITTSDKKDD